MEPCRPATGMATLVRRAIHRTVRLPPLFYANYTIGYDKRTFKGNAYGIGCSWGYSKLLSTRWNFIVEIGAGIIYTPYTEKLRPKYIGEFDDEYTYHHRRFLLVPIKCNLSFSYLF